MIEDCEIQPETNSSEATYGLVLTFSAGQLQHLATYTENERDSWIAALRSASHRQMRSHLEDLRSRLKAKTMNSTEPSNSSVIGNRKGGTNRKSPTGMHIFCADNVFNWK